MELSPIIFFILILLGSSAGGFGSGYLLLEKYHPIINIESKAIEKDYNSDILFIQAAINKFKENHNYSKENYNCVNYSEDFQDLMIEFGYDVRIKSGEKKDNSESGYSGHAWDQVCIDVETINGRVVDYKDKYSIYQNKYYLEMNETRILGIW